MELKALILVGAPVSDGTAQEPQMVAGVPFACLDVLGASVLERVAQRLRAIGISQLSLISNVGSDARTAMERVFHKSGLDSIAESGDSFWEAADETFEQFRQSGTEVVLILNLGPYVELDYEALIQRHIVKRCRMTTVITPEGEMPGIFVVDASRRGDASTLLRSGLRKVRDDCERFVTNGYVNALRTTSDFRRLAIDGLLERNAIRPIGRQLKPGVWVGDGARIHRKARVLAPAFIGAHSTIRAASLVTRTSVIEHHAEVDCGTVVENSTVLPYTYVGAGLDVMHSIVGFRRIANLVRDVAVEIQDTKLVGTSPESAVFRTLGSFAAFFAVLSKKCRGFSVGVRNLRPARKAQALEPQSTTIAPPDVKQPASGQEVGEFPANFAVVRRYGEH